MMREDRWIFAALVIVLFSIISPTLWAAETYPAKELRIIAALSPGGGVDRMARAVQRFLPDVLKVSVLVENRPGAGGKVGIREFLREPPDGHTILAFHQPGITEILTKDPEVGKLEDFAFININWTDPTILVCHKDIGWKTLEDMIQAAKKEPGKYRFSIPGAASAGALMPKMLFDKLGLQIRIAPYGGGGEARAALMGKHVDMTAGGAEGMLAIEKVAQGLGVFWEKPISSWPDARPVNEYLAKYKVNMPNAASLRLFAVRKEFKEKYPERWNTLVGAFQKLLTEHKGFQEMCDKGFIGRDWIGPEKSWALVKEADEVFSKILAPVEKK